MSPVSTRVAAPTVLRPGEAEPGQPFDQLGHRAQRYPAQVTAAAEHDALDLTGVGAGAELGDHPGDDPVDAVLVGFPRRTHRAHGRATPAPVRPHVRRPHFSTRPLIDAPSLSPPGPVNTPRRGGPTHAPRGRSMLSTGVVRRRVRAGKGRPDRHAG